MPDTRARRPVDDVLQPAAFGRVRLGGYLARKVDLSIRNRILAQDPEVLVEPFRHREERSCWQSEYWGKWFLSATSAAGYTRDASARERLRSTVQALLATQSPDGYIGNYPPGKRLDYWDIWGRKYTLLGLLAWFDFTGDASALEASKRLTRQLLTEVGPDHADIVRTGLYRGMASSSVLDPVVRLYHRTNDEQFLRFAEYIVWQWSSKQGPQLIEKAMAGVPVAERFPRPQKWFSWENGGKAYEMMSCYSGLLDLYRETGRPEYLEAARKAHQNIRDTEINIAGNGAADECWYGGKAKQTEPASRMMETCVAMSWMELNSHLLRLTADSLYADEIERTAYNALFGAMTPDGAAFAKYSSLDGVRALSPPDCGVPMNCCTANGPRAVMMIPEFAVMTHADGPVVNLYSEGSWDLNTPSGAGLRMDVKTGYPFAESVEMVARPEREETFRLRLRVPAWSERTTIAVNGTAIGEVTPGAYTAIERRWKTGDRVSLKLDLRGRMIGADSGTRKYVAIVRGPLVLARDARLGQDAVDQPVAPPADERGFLNLKSVPAPDGVDVAASAGAGSAEVRLCDFASAGNTWDERSRFRVWMPLA